MKKYLGALLVALVAAIPMGYANAEENDSVIIVNKYDNEIEVNFEEDIDIDQITDSMLQTIVDQSADLNDESDSVTIHSIDDGDEVNEVDEEYLNENDEIDTDNTFNLMAAATWNVSKKVTGSYVNGRAQQIISVARGATTTLSSSYTITNKRTVSLTGGGSLPSGLSGSITSGMESTKSKTITVNRKFTGPDKKSSYNTTIYYITPFRDTGTWSAYKSNKKSKKYTGSWSQPAKNGAFVEWSQNYK
ncbi:hypothetical protein [Alkalicoccobacillus murimartini]|uniref:Uncharacterized protein (UPF0333 family) n=1 Tax=Alkalicoccobacillus murimartini TaxID=171685 RepID=A0ABT9YL42_9BACI|nr:hypothetical protein [Alkalicoccobacillus murimartini]MDQ0208596.1 uncharacterized protein (UPF0333 family) [Alkalicoccobacillus murimartini]